MTRLISCCVVPTVAANSAVAALKDVYGRRGQIERDVRVVDVSDAGDWSLVRVWYAPIGDLGLRANPVQGFIYAGGEAGGTTPAPSFKAPVWATNDWKPGNGLALVAASLARAKPASAICTRLALTLPITSPSIMTWFANISPFNFPLGKMCKLSHSTLPSILPAHITAPCDKTLLVIRIFRPIMEDSDASMAKFSLSLNMLDL